MYNVKRFINLIKNKNMNKNLLISLAVVALFVVGVYFIVKNAPEKEAVTNNNQEMPVNMNGETNESIDAPQMVVLKEGVGEAVTKAGDTVAVLYAGYLENGEVFDTNVESGQNFEFTLGVGQVISGWEIGLIGMKVGEVRRLLLPPAFAYGNNEVGPIPANSTLIFDVELKEIK